MKFKLTRDIPSCIKSLSQKMIKTFIFLFCTTIFSFNTNIGFSQNAKIKIDSDKVISVEEIFNLIKKQTNYQFIYDFDIIKDAPGINVKKGTIKASALLKMGLNPIHCTYEFNNNTVIVKKKNKDIYKKLSGVVTDKAGIPFEEVTVIIKGTIRGTSTNSKGKYTLNVKPGDTIEFSYIGFKTQEFIITNQTTLNVVLIEEVNVLDEVVLTGYQRLSQVKSTGAVKSINSKTIERKGNSNILESLEGQVSGLGMIFDPENEGQVKFDVRGITSLNGNSSPLIIVDGFPLEGSISSINPYEVASVNVLKDAAASSIYGARAANGVIVITTKKGKKGNLKINYRTSYTIKEKSNLAYRLNRVNSSDLVDIQERNAQNDNYPTGFHTYEYLYNAYPNWRGYFSPARNLVFDAYTQLNDGIITQSELDTRLNKLRGQDNTKQFSDHFLQQETEKQHSLSFSGGGEKGTYRASLSAITNEGSWAGNKSDKIIFGLVNNYKVNDKIDIDFSTNVIWNNRKSIPIDESVVFGSVNSYENIIDANGNALPVSAGLIDGVGGSKDPFYIKKLVEAGLLDETYYPLKELEERSNTSKDLSIRVQARINAKFSEALTGHVGFQYETGNTNIERYSSGESFEMKQLINNTTPLDFGGDLTKLNIPLGGRFVETRVNRNSYTLRGQLDFNNFFDDHEITAIAGSEIRNIHNRNVVNDKFGYDPKTLLFKHVDKDRLKFVQDVYNYQGNTMQVPFLDNFNESTNRFFSVYGNATYGYKNKYILAGSIRMDQSNLFGTDPEFRYKPFWSVSAKWRIAEENFFNLKAINKLDFRVSHGINGNISNQHGPFDIAQYGISDLTGATALSVSQVLLLQI